MPRVSQLRLHHLSPADVQRLYSELRSSGSTGHHENAISVETGRAVGFAPATSAGPRGYLGPSNFCA